MKRTVNSTVEPAIEVREEVTIHHLIAGAKVLPGGRLHLHGICVGDIVVESGGEAHIHGIANGLVRCAGGEVFVRGMANRVNAESGLVEIYGVVNALAKEGAKVVIHDKAIVRG